MLSHKTFTHTATVIFVAVAVLHALRLVYQWDAVIGGFAVPMQVSWIAVLAAGYLAYQGYEHGK